MTIDEAKKIAEVHCGDRVDASRFVEIAVALGMLKLDEPKSVEPLCAEDPDWNWWLLQTKEFKAQTVMELRARADEPKNATTCHSDRALGLLVNACKGVPFLATTIQETIDRAGLKLSEK